MSKAKETEKTPAVSNEQIIAALIQNTTISGAAEAVGLSARAIYIRMKECDFEAAYTHAKADLMRGAVINVNRKLSQAVDTCAEIMEDKSINPATRLQAAQTILNNAAKLSGNLACDEYNARESLNKFEREKSVGKWPWE